MIALAADLPCALTAASCVLGLAWSILELLACILIFGAVVAFAWIHLDSSALHRRVRRYFKSEDGQ